MGDFNANPFWPVWFRLLQTALEAAPTLLCGLLIAAFIRGFVRPNWLRSVFTNDARTGPIRAALIGFLLPVCSFGVLPVAWELRRAGVWRGTVLTFLLSAPITNPLSLVSALQKLGPQGVLAISGFAGMLLVAYLVFVGIGILLNLLLPEPAREADDLPAPPGDVSQRLLVLGVASARGLTSILSLFLIIGLLGSGLLALYPGGALERAANDRSQLGPLHMALAALPAQLPPEKGSAILCDMLLAGNKLGIAFVFLVLGIGLNLGTLVWIGWAYGVRSTLLVLFPLVAATLAIGLATPFKLPGLPANVETESHFLEIEATGGADLARTRALEDTLIDESGQRQWLQIVACSALAVLILAGIVCRVIGEAASPHALMARSMKTQAPEPASTWKMPLTAPHLGAAGLILGLIVVIAALYLIYPAPATVLDDMNSVQVELNLTLKKTPLAKPLALNLIGQWQRLQSKLTLGDFLRRGRFNSPLRQPAEELRVGIQKLRAAVQADGSPEELAGLYQEARGAAERCRAGVGA